MKRPYILLASLLLAAGCAHVQPEPHNVFSEFAADDIAKVVLADDKSFGKGGLSLLPVEVTDRIVINQMYAACRNTPLHGGMSGPFIGILGYQVFLNGKSNVLAVVHIINWQSNVNLQKGDLIDGKIYTRDAYWTSGESEPYCRIVYDLMKKDLPKEIEFMDKMYMRSNRKTVEQMLFEKDE